MNYLDDVPEENAFDLGGTKIRNLYGLLYELRNLEDEDYAQYASRNHNYFADWVEHVIRDTKLASGLRSTLSRKQAAKLVEARINDAKSRPGRKEPEPSFRKESPADRLEFEVPKEKTVEMLKEIAKDEREIKDFLWKHFAWDMAKEFMYGMALGILVGLVLSRVFLA